MNSLGVDVDLSASKMPALSKTGGEGRGLLGFRIVRPESEDGDRGRGVRDALVDSSSCRSLRPSLRTLRISSFATACISSIICCMSGKYIDEEWGVALRCASKRLRACSLAFACSLSCVLRERLHGGSQGMSLYLFSSEDMMETYSSSRSSSGIICPAY